MASQPKSSAMRSAAMYILHCSRIWPSVSSVSGFGPVRNCMPLLVEPVAHGARFAHPETSRMAAYSADWLSRSLKTPVGCSSSSGMMALYMPMQPSSKTPMMALFDRSSSREFLPAADGRRRQICNAVSGRTWLVS